MANPQASLLWPHYAAVGAVAFALVAGLFRFLVLDAQDPLKCSALLNEGQWLDRQFKNWQPEGCMLYNYQPKDVVACMPGKRVLFAGDSVARQLFFAFAHLSDPSLPYEPPQDNKKHSDYHLHSPEGDINFEFIWDPFLNTSKITTMLNTGNVGGDRPSLLVIGSGLWYLRYAQHSGGLAAWEGMIDTTFASIQERMPGLADRVVVLPVEEPVTAKLSPTRASSIHPADIDAMNSDLMHRIMELSPSTSIFGPTPPPTYPIAIPAVFNRMLLADDTKDGLHFNNNVLSKHANVLLNFRCNDALPKRFPMNKTCCNSYPQTPFLQLLLVAVIIFFGPFCWYFGPSIVSQRPVLAPFLPSSDYLIPLTVFGAVIGLNFVADRSPIWLKEHKQFDPWIFTGLCLVALAAGLGTLRAKDQEMGFLNREQTDEWKGWMQLAILIYHYLGASKTSGIYNVIRVLVASYLWMTGYGHFHYYYKKADYGILRLAQVLVRLNILTVVLAYVMNTDYMFYYFAPLVSFWYLVIYCTMAFGYKYNDNTPFVIIKLFFSSATITYIFKSQWIVELAFELLSRFCAIHWDAREWMFRVRLDLWIVYIGMFSALVTIKTQQNNWTDHPRWPAVLKGAVGGALLVLVWYFYFELTQPNKFVYNTWHPYISWAPITAYIILRNATPILRSSSSRAFVFIGRCSLETFVMQYHFWMTGDTKGILMVLPLGTAWRTVNMIVSTTGFIYLCHQAAEATGWLTNWVCTTPPVSSLPGGVRKWVALPPPVTTSSQNGTANGRIEEIIPMLPTNTNKSSEDIPPPLPQTHATSSTPKSANTTRAPSSSPPTQTQPPPPPTPPPRPHVSIPPPPSSTVIRPHPRWLERLIEHPDSPGPGWSPYIATRNRVFSAWSDANTTTAMSVSSGGMGLGLKGIVVLACLWVLNLLWPSVGG